MKTTGYIVTSSRVSNTCSDYNGVEAINTIENYEYCVYRFDTARGPYYRVTVFISYDLPFGLSHLKLPVSGETKLIYEL